MRVIFLRAKNCRFKGAEKLRYAAAGRFLLLTLPDTRIMPFLPSCRFVSLVRWTSVAVVMSGLGMAGCTPVETPPTNASMAVAAPVPIADQAHAPRPRVKPQSEVRNVNLSMPTVNEEDAVEDADSGLTTTSKGHQVLKTLPVAAVHVFPDIPAALPDDPAQRVSLLTRPPIAPPIREAGQSADGTQTNGSSDSAQRCAEAVNAARSLVERPLSLPVDKLKERGWKEQALRGTELTQLACQGEAGEQAAAYWRATAFVLHGQYRRASVNYRRVIEIPGPFANWGYVQGLADMLETCARADRPSLDAWTLAGLLEARGAVNDARLLYSRAVQARCAPLRTWAKARLAVIGD